MKIRKFKLNEFREVGRLIGNTFSEFNNKDGTKRAVQKYIDFFMKSSDEDLKRSFSLSSIFYVAEINNKIIGVIRGSEKRITNLFVLGKYHNKGVGRKLIERFENESVKEGSEFVKTDASIYAVPFYQKMGYKKTTGVRNWRGLKVQPMRKKLI